MRLARDRGHRAVHHLRRTARPTRRRALRSLPHPRRLPGDESIPDRDASPRRTNIYYIRPWHLGHICYLRVAQDRLSFYEGWDEVSESWVDAIDYLDDGL